MFGYVRPALAQLSETDQQAYRGAYCGLCHVMGRRHGFWSRMTLNYDFTFLAILFSTQGETCWEERRCPVHPLRKKRSCLCGASLERAADASILLTWYKLQDDVQDKGFFAGLPARLLGWFFARSARRAKVNCQGFAAQVEKGLAHLAYLEKERSAQLDRAADAFACILRAAAPETGGEGERRVMEQLLCHLGRWIYLVDAWDDLAEDKAAGRYNPLDVRFQGQAEKERAYVSTTMTHSLRLAISAANLLEPGRWQAVIQHILYQGLPAVQEAVLSGHWKELKKPYREKT